MGPAWTCSRLIAQGYWSLSPRRDSYDVSKLLTLKPRCSDWSGTDRSVTATQQVCLTGKWSHMNGGGRNMVERTSKFLLIVVGSVFFMLILYQYVAPGMMNFGSPHGYLLEDDADIYPTPDPHYVKKYYFPIRELERTVDFEIKGDDVIVFLHIQKTGGTTFGRHLVQNVRLELPCDCRPGQKKCTCYRPNRKETWLFSRFSTGWSCGLHADWTELTNCVPGVLNKKENKLKKPRYDTGWLSRWHRLSPVCGGLSHIRCFIPRARINMCKRCLRKWNLLGSVSYCGAFFYSFWGPLSDFVLCFQRRFVSGRPCFCWFHTSLDTGL